MLKLAMSKINDLFSLIASTEELYAPIEKANKVEFYKWNENEKVRFDVLNTVKSAKDFFFPQSEELMEFKTDGKHIQVMADDKEEPSSVYFGVRQCDVKSFEILDRVFLSEPVDSFYAGKREKGTIVAMGCNKPEHTCFCTAFGIDPTNPTADVVTWIVNDELYWESQTDKGAALTEKVKDLFEEADATCVEEKKAQVKEILEKAPLADLSLEGFTPDRLKELFDSYKWPDLSKACLACGTCTFVCPTCQCYDIRDFKTNEGVKRSRCWDSCMYSDFTMMAHGNNRNSQVERFRQRFMHKLVYYPSNNEGIYSCVGCGRCLQKCPVSLNIVKVIKALGGTDNE